ncbi:MAG: methyltransferase domain-containing protein [Chloroflexota bacterium]
MASSESGQVSHRVAEVWEDVFVPILMQWAGPVADAARIQPGQRVLDVACGTGVLARAVAQRVGPEGAVVGLDLNEGMLAVAGRKAPHIEWRQGRAEDLPFEGQSFDCVVSQFGLMFFADRRAVQEMVRVLRPAGYLAVAVWGRLEDSPAYAVFADLLQSSLGDQAADEVRAPFSLGDPQRLRSLFADTGLSAVEIASREEIARFSSVREMVLTEIQGLRLGMAVSEAQERLLLEEAERVLQPFVTTEGTLAFPMRAHILSALKA